VHGAADSFFEPTDMGAIAFGRAIDADLSDDAQFHAFHFDLSGPAGVVLSTADAGASDLDTVMYLYKRGDSGWGSYIAKDDDGGGAYFSKLSESLDAGQYRVIVKGYSLEQVGPYRLESACSGDGCAPALSDDCLFGERYGDFLHSPNFETVVSADLTSETALSELQRAQIIATLDIYGESITDPSEAFEIVDQGYINYTTQRDAFDGSEYTALEFGAGDNSFGAILRGGTTEAAAVIVDGDLDGCSAFEPLGRWAIAAEQVPPEASLVAAFPHRLFAMKLSSGFVPGRTLANSAYDDLVDAAHAIVDGEDPCYGFPTGADTGLDDYWDPAYLDSWMGSGHVQSGWQDAPTATQRAALQSYFAAVGTDNIEGFQGDMLPEACGGSGAGYFFLFLNKQTGDVTILLVYRYTE